MNLINIIFIILILIIFYLINIFLNNKNSKKENFTQHFNIPVAINPDVCAEDKTIVMDYDEINLNTIKTNSLDMKIELETEQKPIILKEKLYNLPKVTTYMELPGYLASNIELFNKYELKENNYGLINYTELKDNERFRPKNSLIKQFSKSI
jgi:hypothetical protein